MFINKAKSFDNVGADVAKGGGTNARLKGGGIFTRRQTFVVRGTGTGTSSAPSNVTG